MIVTCAHCGKQGALTSCLLDRDGRGASFPCESCGERHFVPFSEPSHTSPEARGDFAEESLSSPATSPLSREETTDLRRQVEHIVNNVDAVQIIWPGFEALLSKWDDSTAHSAQLFAAKEVGGLATLGACYRVFLSIHPDDTAAKKAQETLMVLAMADLQRDEAPESSQGSVIIRWAALALSFALFAYAIWTMTELL